MCVRKRGREMEGGGGISDSLYSKSEREKRNHYKFDNNP